MVRCFVKGAPDQLLTRAATVADADVGPAPADGEFGQRFLAENQRLGEEDLRVIAVARKDFDPAAFDAGADLLSLITELELLALLGIVDPPRPTARASIATATKVGIRVRMITGGYAVTATAAARQLGIDGTVITGAEFGAMSDEEALNKIDDIGVLSSSLDPGLWLRRGKLASGPSRAGPRRESGPGPRPGWKSRGSHDPGTPGE